MFVVFQNAVNCRSIDEVIMAAAHDGTYVTAIQIHMHAQHMHRLVRIRETYTEV